MKRILLVAAIFFSAWTGTFAAWPYDSICEILVPNGPFYNGGSATFVAATETEALLLTCQHVAEKVGDKVQINWASTGEQGEGEVIAIAPDGLDAAIVRCPRPKDLRPVPVSSIDPCKHEFIVNAGFPGVTGTLEWQKGRITFLDSTDLQYDCRPIPGMSGGATLDKYGNLVGVIQYYNRFGGGSTSGTKLMEFLSKFIRASPTTRHGTAVQHETLVVETDGIPEVEAPEDWDAFQLHMLVEFGVLPVDLFFVPEPELAPTPEAVEDEASIDFELNMGPHIELHIDDAPRINKPRRAYRKPAPNRRRRFFQRRR